MIVGVSGTRDKTSPAHFARAMELLATVISAPVTAIVTGDCLTGIDELARSWARWHRIQLVVKYADWDIGKRGGPKRNAKIVAASDVLVALPGPTSRGTWDTYRKAVKKGMAILLVHPNGRWAYTPPREQLNLFQGDRCDNEKT